MTSPSSLALRKGRRRGARFPALRRLAGVLVALLLIYLLVCGAILARMATDALTVDAPAGAASVQRPGDPLELGYRGDPLAGLGIDFEAVEVATELGPAEAWLIAGHPDAPFAAIYIHGLGGAREDGYRHLSMLHEAGIPALLISYRNDAGGAAGWDGRYGFGLTEWRDLEAAVLLMRDLGHPRLLVVAESMGGAVLGQFLHRSELAASVIAVALDSPALDLADVLAHRVRLRRLPLAPAIVRVGGQIMRARGVIDLAEASVADRFAAFEGPLFLAHGSTDGLVPLAPSLRMVAAREGATVLLKTQADHLLSWQEDPARYRRAFAAFLAMLPPLAP